MNWELELYRLITHTLLTKKSSVKVLYIDNYKILFEANKNRISFYSNNKEVDYVDLSFPNRFFQAINYSINLYDIIENNFKYLSDKVKDFVNRKNNLTNNIEFTNRDQSQNKIYLICTLDEGKYISILNSLRKNKLSNFNKEEIKSLAYSVFAYWEGKKNTEPESIKLIINEQSSVENDLKDGYFIIYFDNKLANKRELSKIYKSSVYDREDALNYISKYLGNDYQISNIFLKLPDGCNII